MNRQGWIRTHRKTIDSRIFRDSHLYKIFSWCLMKAATKAEDVPFNAGNKKIIVHLKPGQFIFGRFSAAKELYMKPSTLQYRLQRIVKMGCLTIYPFKTHSIIYVTKWAIYQAKEDSKKEEKKTNNTVFGTLDSMEKDGERWEQRVVWVRSD